MPHGYYVDRYACVLQRAREGAYGHGYDSSSYSDKGILQAHIRPSLGGRGRWRPDEAHDNGALTIFTPPQ